MSRRTLLVVTLACVCVTQISVTRVYTQGRGQALVLPEGAGKETVQSQCSKCHALNLIGTRDKGGLTCSGRWSFLETWRRVRSPTTSRRIFQSSLGRLRW